jgi:tetratricopeptide (TPR) repeat protein
LDLRKRKYDVTKEVRALYLKGCSRMGDLSQQRDEQAISAFRQATQMVPKFAPAWAHLAYALFASIDSAPPGRRSEVAWTSGGYNQIAKRLDPSLPEPYYVAAFNGPSHPSKMAEALAIIDEGLRHNDESALLFDARSQILANLGLLREALESSKRAIDLEPLSPTYLGNYLRMLAYTGQMDAARRELDDARRSWPRSPSIAIIQYYFDLRYGDARRALNILRSGDMGPTNSDEGTQLYLQARISPTPANVEGVLGYYRLQFEKDPEDTFRYVQALGTFGHFNDAYSVLLGKPEAVENFTRDGEGLFRPYMRPMLNDPRFMDVAFRTGMLTYWRKSGRWPDFCSHPKLPYDCQREAAKYPMEPPKLPN